MKHLLFVTFCLLATPLANAAESVSAVKPAEAVSTTKEAPGKALHEKACTSCHGSEVYTREDRKMQSLDSLKSQVARCNANTRAGWFDDEMESVTNFLNDSFYHFKTQK
ncbi:MAG: cytochrome c [Gammaproteobacteria bacterium]